MTSSDYIPRRDVEFKFLCDRVMDFLGEKGEACGIPPTALTTLLPYYERYAAAYEQASDRENRTHAIVFEKNESKKEMTKAIRRCVNEYIAYNSKVTNAEREALGLNLRPTAQPKNWVPVLPQSP